MWKVWRRKITRGNLENWALVLLRQNYTCISVQMHSGSAPCRLSASRSSHPVLSDEVFLCFFRFFHLQMPTMIICNFRNKGAQKQHLWFHIFLWDSKCMSYAYLQPGAIYSQTSFLCTPFSSGPDWLQGLKVVPRLTLSLQRVSSTS